MVENIRINEEGNIVYLSEEMISQIKTLLKGNRFTTHLREQIESLTTDGINYRDFKELMYSIIVHFNIVVNHDIPSSLHLDEQLIEQFNELKAQYSQLDPNHYEKIFSNIFSTSNRFLGQEQLETIEQIINTSLQLKETEDKIFFLRDLTAAKDDYITDMKYFMSEEEINKFNLEYSQALKEKNIDKMKELLTEVQNKILKEWENYIGNVDNMTDDNFCFLGHSTNVTKYEGDFHSRYVSSSLLNQDINDTLNSRFGFIMAPTKIVGACSQDMYVYNNSYDEETLTYSSILQIHHPQRLIDECKKQKQDNIEQNNDKKVYNEVVLDGFEPIGIFCFTNGAKGLDNNYQQALELQKRFPHLKIKVIDIMKTKTGPELKSMELELVNSLLKKNNGNSIEITDLPRYELFLKKFNELKEQDNYNEEDIEKLFKRNGYLLSTINMNPDNLFSGKLDDEEIKFVLGKNFNYNIDYILNGNITEYSISRLQILDKYKDKLNKYYDGLSEFIDIITRVPHIDAKIIENIKKEKPINFYKMSKCILKEITDNLDNKQNEAKSKLNELKKQYQSLTKEQKERKEIEDKANIYRTISSNRVWLDLLKKQYNSLNSKIKKNSIEEEALTLLKQKLERKISELEKVATTEELKDYKKDSYYIELQNKITTLKNEQKNLEKNPIINFAKIRKIKIEIKDLEAKQLINEETLIKNSNNKISGIEQEISYLKLDLQHIEEELKLINEEKKQLQKELSNLNKEVHEKFHCNSIDEVEYKIKEANDYIENYDYSNRLILQDIEKKLEEIQNQILFHQNQSQFIEEERKRISR